jgi:hypothetical protein
MYPQLCRALQSIADIYIFIGALSSSKWGTVTLVNDNRGAKTQLREAEAQIPVPVTFQPATVC